MRICLLHFGMVSYLCVEKGKSARFIVSVCCCIGVVQLVAAFFMVFGRNTKEIALSVFFINLAFLSVDSLHLSLVSL